MKKLLSIAIMMTLTGCSTMTSQTLHADASMKDIASPSLIPSLVSNQYDVKKNRYYEKLTSGESSSINFEKDKILYLIEELRESPYQFERNGEVHQSSRAAQHLMMKYNFAKNKIKTANEFINLIASRSSKTGEDYQVIFDGNAKYPAQLILGNELQKLNQVLALHGGQS